ncbi:MAG: hypothetical protein MJ240_02010 [Kiritimatiellae bacterium]|nr:hypothetical protein [Kiritimatiellia bacterium]
MNDVIHWVVHPTQEEATRLVDEFCACWKLVLTEVQLLDEEEMLNIYPQRPIRDDSIELVAEDFDFMSAEEASAENRRYAKEDYCRRLQGLMPPANAPSARHPMLDLVQTTSNLVEAAKEQKFTTSTPFSNDDYELLAHILNVDTTLTYNVFEATDPAEEDNPETWNTIKQNESTPEDQYKGEIIRNLKLYLSTLCDLAKEIESKSIEDLVRSQEIISINNGRFFTNGRKRQIGVSSQLKTFITCLRRGLATFWVDHKNYNPAKTRKDVAEIKAHVTAEADREIAAKAPKRKRKFGHEGNGLKGPKSTFMMRQRKIFEKYLAVHPVDGKNTRIVRAHQCWLQHKDAWDRAAKAQGDAKGYANHKILAQAK